MSHEKLKAGIAAAKAGNRAEARRLLADVVEADETQLSAWLWLGYATDNLAEKEICFENALTLDPENDFAAKGLAWVRRQKKSPRPESPAVPEIDRAAQYPTRDEFDDEWLCPFCARPTAPTDTVCPHCGKSLIRRVRVRPDRSAWLWRGFFLQVYVAFYALALPAGYLTLAATLRDMENPFPYLPFYLGAPVDVPPNVMALMLEIFPRWAFWGAVGISVFSVLMMIILIFRVPFGHLLYLLNAGLVLLLSLMGLALGAGWVRILSGTGLAVALFQLMITFNLWKDFSFDETRLKLTVDSGVKEAASLFLSGRDYGRRGMWGKAVIHLRRAAAKHPAHPGYWLALAVAYLNIRRPDLAEKALDEAEKVEPISAELRKLRAKTAEMKKRIA